MRNLIFLFVLTFFIGCTPQKEVSKNRVHKENKVKKEGRKIYGKIVSKYIGPMLTDEWPETKRPDLSFQIGNEYYLIKYANEGVSPFELNRLAEKEIEVRGKLIGNGWVGEASNTVPKRKVKGDGKKIEEMGYILIYEILED